MEKKAHQSTIDFFSPQCQCKAKQVATREGINDARLAPPWRRNEDLAGHEKPSSSAASRRIIKLVEFGEIYASRSQFSRRGGGRKREMAGRE